MRKWTRLGRVTVYGAPLYVHWTVFVAVMLLAVLSFKSPLYGGLAIACYLGVIIIHELGHAWVATRLGYEVEAVRIAFFHGACECEAPHSEWEEVLVSWGGVAAQLAVALIVLVVAAAFGGRDPGYFGPVVAFWVTSTC